MDTPQFDPENEIRPYVAVNAVIFKTIEGTPHILLGKRLGVAGAGNYYLPGGHIKMGESIPDALMREVREECGIDVSVGRCMWIEENNVGAHHITFYYEAIQAESKEPVNTEPSKCEGWEWYPVAHPPSPLWVTLEKFLIEYRSRDRVFRFAKPGKDFIGSAAVGVVIRRRNKKPIILNEEFYRSARPEDLEMFLQKRGGTSRGEHGVWSCPGGEIVWGESFADAIRREVSEETGATVTVGDLLYTVEQITPEYGKHWLIHMHVCVVAEGEPSNREPDKFDDVGWFPVMDLPEHLDRGIRETREILLKKFLH